MSNNKLVRSGYNCSKRRPSDTHGAFPEALPMCKLQHPVIKLLTIWNASSCDHTSTGRLCFSPWDLKTMEDTFCCVSDRSVVLLLQASFKNTAATSSDNPAKRWDDEKERDWRNGNGENWLKRWIRGRLASDPDREKVTALCAVWCCTINARFTHEGAICTCT